MMSTMILDPAWKTNFMSYFSSPATFHGIFAAFFFLPLADTRGSMKRGIVLKIHRVNKKSRDCKGSDDETKNRSAHDKTKNGAGETKSETKSETKQNTRVHIKLQHNIKA
mmetsp:Transcript_5994/g.8882  ORF Transcript_5994/g.8882 Transcript_5994/m.8882 type:complete len:110 (-) Transcript_5994:138-467(-)